jgi:hypothetical protein
MSEYRSSFLDVPLKPNPVIEAYKKDIDRTLLRENLRLAVQQRVDKFLSALHLTEEIRRAGRAVALKS